ncbi:hypothetical protein QE152_g37180 [Popillia japonica]|uniref:Uncharacterized protein n=1 Tax=Popillia japonica TaxID=7064 RepID=A0AAW1IAD9_POPJA
MEGHLEEDMITENNNTSNEEGCDITIEEIIEAIGNLKNEKAFDNAPSEMIWKVLKQRGITPNYKQAIRGIYNQEGSTSRWGNKSAAVYLIDE